MMKIALTLAAVFALSNVAFAEAPQATTEGAEATAPAKKHTGKHARHEETATKKNKKAKKAAAEHEAHEAHEAHETAAPAAAAEETPAK
jgi:hypothetical protein